MTDKQAFMLFFGLRIFAILLFIAGVYAVRQGTPVLGYAAVAIGALTLLVRPKHLRLTGRK